MNKKLQFLIYSTPQENIKIDVVGVSILEITTIHGAISGKTQMHQVKFNKTQKIISDFDKVIKQMEERHDFH